MGKLLQKLVNGIAPSWLTKIKSSSAAHSSPKKLLPFFRGGTTHVSSKSSAISPSSTANNTGVLPLVRHDQSNQSSNGEKEPCAEACGESSAVSASPSLIKQGRTAEKNNDKHHHRQDHSDLHDPHHGDVKPNHDTQSAACPAYRSSREHNLLSIDKDNKEHDLHYQQHHGNPDDRNHQHQVEHRRNQDDHRKHELRGFQERRPCMEEDVNHRYHQETRSSRHENADNVEPNQCGSKEFSEFKREFQCLQEEDNNQNHNEEDHDQGADNGNGYDKRGYHDLAGLKRKRQYLDGEEEDGGEGEEGGGHGSSRMKWGWKRRNGERGVMSCELPESICCIVGNSKAVVKLSPQPHLALWESMVEMIVGNGLWELGNLEFLLFCYLSLNEPHLHPLIQSCFLQVLQDLERIS